MAIPQPMAGQPEASDDLIAELAKLMAQDAQPARTAEQPRPSEPARPAFAVRIPGGDTAPAIASELRSEPAAAPKLTVASAKEPEPFNFDFDFGVRKPAAEPAAPQINAQPMPPRAVVLPPVQQPAASSPAPSAQDHDSIADLIAAEFAVPAERSPAAVGPVPQPVAAPQGEPTIPPTVIAAAAPSPAPVPQQRSANLTAVNVSANASGQDRQARPALKSVNLQPAARPEQDRFKVPPVFGLATPGAAAPVVPPQPVEPVFVPPAPVAPRPAADSYAMAAETQVAPPRVEPPAPARDQSNIGSDPIDEIESLIGRAVRVELLNNQPRAAAAEVVSTRPALQQLAATPAEPQSAAPSATVALSGADEAILEAARATGAQVGWVEVAEGVDEVPPPRQREPRAPRALGMTRAVAGPLVAVTLLLAAGFGLYWVLGLGGGEAGPAPLLTADASPVKETPVVEPDAAAAQQSVVFNEIDGVIPGAEETLVSRDQADVNEVTQVPIPEVSEEGLANRKVRTVTVRPDGTIVSGDDAVAGSAILPVDRPSVPVVPGAETASPELVAAVDPVAAVPQTPAPAPTVIPVEPGTMVAVVDAAGNPVAGKTAPVPLLRPADLVQSSAPTAPVAAIEPTSPVNAIVDPATAVAPLAVAPVATAPVNAAADPVAAATEVESLPNNAPAYAQLASLRSEEEARQAASNLITRFGPLFGGANMEVQRVDLGSRGIYYRVRVPASSMQEANSICTNVTAAGGECVAM